MIAAVSWRRFFGDGRPPLALTGAALFASGGFAIFQSITGHLLPHDSHALGMDAEGLTCVTACAPDRIAPREFPWPGAAALDRLTANHREAVPISLVA